MQHGGVEPTRYSLCPNITMPRYYTESDYQSQLKGGMHLIEMDESEYLESDFTDEVLRKIAGVCGPWTANQLLLPGPVPVRRPLGVKIRACMTRSLRWLMRYGRTVFL